MGIKALLRRVGAQVRINSEGTHAPSEARDCDWTFAVLGSLAPPKARETSTTPAFGLIGLGLMYVANLTQPLRPINVRSR